MLGLGAPTSLPDMCWVNGILNNISWVHLADSFETAWCRKPGVMQTFAFPPGSSNMFHQPRVLDGGGGGR